MVDGALRERVVALTEAMGWGGIASIARATGPAISTVTLGYTSR